MAMARSFGNSVRQTKAWRRVEMNKMATIVDDTKERESARPLLIIVGTCSAYLMVATEAVVMGKVYDHHATENLQDYVWWLNLMVNG